MADAPRPYLVTPHGPLARIDDNLWSVESPVPAIPGGRFPRRMTIFVRADGGLVFHNAIPLDDATLEAVRALGRPAQLVLPSRFHAFDAHAFREKLGVAAYCPQASRDAIGATVLITGTVEEIPSDPRLSFVAIPGSRTGEGALAITSLDDRRVTLVLCDLFLNVPHLSGMWGLIFRISGFTGGIRISPAWRKAAMADAAVLRASAERLAEIPKLARLVPSHGPVIEERPAEVLRQVARMIE